MEENYEYKTLSGLVWSLIEFVINTGAHLFIYIILARIIQPSDYGLVGMVSIFIAFSMIFINSGFSQALIRKIDVSKEDYSTVFFFNLTISIILYLIFFFFAGVISEFFSEHALILILRILTIVIIINAFSIIPETILVKKIDFKTLAKVSLISNIISGLIAVLLAYSGFGIWSLVLYTLSTSFFKGFLLWIYIKWIPLLTFNVKSFKESFTFGSKLFISGIIDTVYNNISPLLIGRFYSTSELGYYTNAYNINTLISSLISSSIQRVTYPVLSSIQYTT